MSRFPSSAITLATAKVRKANKRVEAIEKATNSLWSRARRGEVSQEHYVLKSKQLADELTRAVDVEADALRDFFEASLREQGQDPYESDDSELGDLLSLSAAGGT